MIEQNTVERIFDNLIKLKIHIKENVLENLFIKVFLYINR